MKNKLKSILKPVLLLMLSCGFNPIKLFALRFYFRFRKEWIKEGGKITKNSMILSDYMDVAGSAKGN
jgi:hypothetical protein